PISGGDRHWRRSSSSGGNLARELTVGSLARRRQRIFGFGVWRGSHAQISVSAENAVVSNTVRRAVAQLGSALHWGCRGRGFKSRQPDHYVLARHRSCRRAIHHVDRHRPEPTPGHWRIAVVESPFLGAPASPGTENRRYGECTSRVNPATPEPGPA